MKKVHVFNAGPCLLPQKVYDEAIEAIKNFADTGISLLSISHRTKEWDAIMNETRDLWREILNIPEEYETLFLGGGASLEFLRIPYNFLEKKAGYVDTGVWAHNAMVQAQAFGEVVTVASSADKNYSYVPKGYDIPKDLDYLHITTNNTIYGTELREDIDSPVPVIADMSSDILTRPIDVSKYMMIYGGAQKNAGPAGVAFVIVRKDALGKVSRKIPTMMDYGVHLDKESMFNTPPVFSIYVMNRTLHWIKDQGGLQAIMKMNDLKAKTLYDEIERNPLFKTVTAPEDRSIMNVCFVPADGVEDFHDEFIAFAKQRGIVGIGGHRKVGGFRASLYNASTIEDVEALVAAMREFEQLKTK